MIRLFANTEWMPNFSVAYFPQIYRRLPGQFRQFWFVAGEGRKDRAIQRSGAAKNRKDW